MSMMKNLRIKTTSSLLAILFLLPLVATADTVLRTGDFVTVGNDQVVEVDFYGAGGSITQSGEIRGDMYTVGGSITQNGLVGADFGALAGTVQIHGPVSDDVRVVGGEVVVGEYVGGDVFVIGGVLKVLSSASIEGDVFFYGGEGQLEGRVGGSVMGASENLRVDGPVAGNVDVVVQSLTLGDRAEVKGDIRYQSQNELVRSQNATVAGEVVRNQTQASNRPVNTESLTILLAWLFATLCLFLFFRQEIQTMVDKIKAEPAKIGLFGLAALFLAPVIFFLLMITVLGALVGVMSLFVWILLLLGAATLASVVLGSYLLTLMKQPGGISLMTVFVGGASILLLLAIPVIGPFVVFVVFVMTLGGLVYSLYQAVR